jgi:hypothetical protein
MGRRGGRFAGLIVTGLAALAPLPARGWAIAEDPSAVTLPAASSSPDVVGIRKVLETYVHAVEAKDVQMFRSVKPNLTEEEERRARAAFKSVQSQTVKMSVLSLEVKEGKATVKVARRDTINGSIVSSFPQTFQLLKDTSGWTIRDIGR